MVFGQTAQQQIDRTSWKMRWHSAYAWWPVRLVDGRWAWLEAVERISYFAAEIRPRTHHTWIGWWCFRLPSSDTRGTGEA